MRTYEFHSALPPETLKQEMDRWVRVENILLDKDGKVKLKWRGGKFTLSMFKREGTTTSYLCPVRGEVFPDGEGGCFLHGEEYISRIGYLCYAAAVGAGASGVLAAPNIITKRIFMGVAVAMIILCVLDALRPTVNSPELEQFLTKNFEELEGG